jgi:hypothetical protein
MVDDIIDRFPFLKDVVWRSDLSTVRWLCHGHIGHAVIWAVYSYCVFKISKNIYKDEKTAKREAQQVLKIEESARLSLCMDFWIRENLGQENEFPCEVFNLLGIPLA